MNFCRRLTSSSPTILLNQDKSQWCKTLIGDRRKPRQKKNMSSARTLAAINKKLLGPSYSAAYLHRGNQLNASQHRSISSTALLQNSWVNKIKGVFTGKKETAEEPTHLSGESFTLLRFAEELSRARKLGSFKKFIVGRSSEATFADSFEKQEAIIRYLGGFDATGENIQTSQKREAAEKCNCTIADVENVLAKFTWAKEANTKMEKLKAEGKPLPKNIAEVQKLMGSTPLDVARANLAKSGQISRNALCPCGSKKRYKRCCGKDKETA